MTQIHFTLALLSVAGFVLRAGWAFNMPEMLERKLVRIAPHVIDTLLLISGVVLALNVPGGFGNTWLIAKIGALVAYIGFGVMTLRGSGTLRLVGLAGALLSVGYIFVVAFNRSAWPF